MKILLFFEHFHVFNRIRICYHSRIRSVIEEKCHECNCYLRLLNHSAHITTARYGSVFSSFFSPILFILPFQMGQSVSREDFIWTLTEQPHMSRRETIVKAHPEIKKVGFFCCFEWAADMLRKLDTQLDICFRIRIVKSNRCHHFIESTNW